VLGGADTVGVVNVLSWRYRDPAGLVAARLGATPRRTLHTVAGGNYPQALLNRAALDIAAGQADLVLLCGAEAWRTRMELRAKGQRPDWTVQPDDLAPTVTLGDDTPMFHPAEMARGLMMPVQQYPIFESALRAASGRSPSEHLVHLSELWAGFSAVAATNPHAWIQRRYTAEELRTVGPDNRMIGYPYPKLMNSNNNVEQGAGVIVCSVARARELGVPSDRWVFPWAGTDARDTPFVSNRPSLCASPAIAVAGSAALALAGVGVDDIAHVDLYSCFPSAVQVAAADLGLGLDRPLTVTGGLSFAGGPWNDYVMHAIATMVEVLRADAGAVGLCTANGGFLTKHAFGVYSTSPPPSGAFRHAAPQAEVDAAGWVELCEEWDGPATVEGATVMHDRDGAAEGGFYAVRLADGRRAWGTSVDPDLLAATERTEVVSRPGRLRPDGTFSLS
jgi:acetyl-CoA C-acetyltransferase